MKKFNLALPCVVCIFLLVSCFSEDVEIPKKKPKRVIVNNIMLILGEDYFQRDAILDYFKQYYDLGQDGSHISVLSYSDISNSKGVVFLRQIYTEIENRKPDIVIALGAPEGSARYLLRAHQEFPKLVLVSLLPMEEVLPLEASCDIVVDYELPDNLLNAEDAFKVSDEDLQLLLVSSVFAAEDIVAKHKELDISYYEEYNRAFFTAQSVLFKPEEQKAFRVKPYVDPETSLPSRKYFIIYDKSESKKESAISPKDEGTESEMDGDSLEDLLSGEKSGTP